MKEQHLPTGEQYASGLSRPLLTPAESVKHLKTALQRDPDSAMEGGYPMGKSDIKRIQSGLDLYAKFIGEEVPETTYEGRPSLDTLQSVENLGRDFMGWHRESKFFIHTVEKDALSAVDNHVENERRKTRERADVIAEALDLVTSGPHIAGKDEEERAAIAKQQTDLIDGLMTVAAQQAERERVVDILEVYPEELGKHREYTEYSVESLDDAIEEYHKSPEVEVRPRDEMGKGYQPRPDIRKTQRMVVPLLAAAEEREEALIDLRKAERELFRDERNAARRAWEQSTTGKVITTVKNIPNILGDDSSIEVELGAGMTIVPSISAALYTGEPKVILAEAGLLGVLTVYEKFRRMHKAKKDKTEEA